MVDVLYFSDREVKRKLFERVDSARRPLVVVQVRQDEHSRPPPEREPFATFARRFGDLVDLLVVADEGTNEGMWRDPVGDLGDRLFPQDGHASWAAATGYLLIVGGRAVAMVKKTGVAQEDLWLLQQALSEHVPGIPPPDPSLRPGKRRPRPAPKPPPPPAPPEVEQDPWELLGIERGLPLAEAKKAFRRLITQYHPDKVAHLAPEFRELAERRTRELLEAWQRIEEAQ